MTSHSKSYLSCWIFNSIFNVFPQMATQTTLYGPGHAKTYLMPYANNKGAEQSAHPRSLISAFIVRCLYSAICILAIPR